MPPRRAVKMLDCLYDLTILACEEFELSRAAAEVGLALVDLEYMLMSCSE